MKLIVDGYNLLKQIKAAYISDSERGAFINALVRYGQHKNLAMIIVFDGGMSSWAEKQLINPLVKVVYAGRGVSADTYIKEFISKSAQQDLLLISTDRHLNRYAASYGIPSLDALDFLQFVRIEQEEYVASDRTEPKKTFTQIIKFEHEEESSSGEVDALMRGISQMQLQKKVRHLKTTASNRVNNEEKLKKKEQILKKKLDKL